MKTQHDPDIIILGQGLAGSLLAWTLIQRGLCVAIIDNTRSSSASRIAAGLFNPVTGQRLVKFTHAEQYIPVARECYSSLEARFGKTFFHNVDMVRLIQDNRDQLAWEKRKNNPEYAPYLGNHYDRDTSSCCHDPLGSFQQHQTGYVDTIGLLDTLSDFFRDTGSFTDNEIDYNDISFANGRVSVADITAKRIIFCEGYRATANPWFSWLPFKPAKGEILTLQTDADLPEQIINAGKWILPISNSQFKTGATYQWHDLDEIPTEKAKQELLESVNTILKQPGNIKLIGHHAGVRPCTKDTKPFIGIHPNYPELGFFNGFGSRGSLIIPFHASQFADFLIDRKKLNTDADIMRYHHA